MPSRNRKKKGKKGGKRAARTTAALAAPPPGDAARASPESEPPDVTDAVSVPDPSGSGGRKASRREEKDTKLTAKGMKRLPSSNPLLRSVVPLVKLSKMLRLNLIGPDGESVVKGNASILRCKRAKDAYATIKQNEGRWEEMLGPVVCFYEERQWTECERSASCVLDDMDRALSHFLTSDDEVEKLVLVHGCQISGRFFRANARTYLGDHQGSIEDATEGLALFEAWEGGGNDESHRYNCYSYLLPVVLYNRGMMVFELGDLRGAEADLRAACALYRLHEDREKFDELSKSVYDEFTKMLLQIKTSQHIQSSVPRPHYTTKQADKIRKELGIGIFSEDNYNCLGCGVEASDCVELFCCGGCNKVWLCGQECQEKAWEEGHERFCRPRSFVMDIEVKKEVEDDIKKIGYCSAKFEGEGIGVICREEETGQLFDSLSNEDVIFVRR